MKRIYLTFIAIISLVNIFTQNEKEFTLTSTNNLVIIASVKVLIYKSDTLKVVVNGGNLSPEIIIITPTDDGITIDANKGKYDFDNTVIEIYTNNINKILVSGAGDVKIVDDFTVPEVTLSTSGISNISGNIVCNKASLTSKGESNIQLCLSAERVYAVASGNSDLKLLEFSSKKMFNNVSGASDIKKVDDFTVPELTLISRGTSSISGNIVYDMSGNIVCNKVSIKSKGESNIQLTGIAERVDVVALGSSNLKLLEFSSKKMHIKVSGVSNAYVDVTGELNAVASGEAGIYYKNDPVKLNENVLGHSYIQKYNGLSIPK